VCRDALLHPVNILVIQTSLKKTFLSIAVSFGVICLLFTIWAVGGRAPVLNLADQPGPEGRAWISLIFDDSEMGQMEAVEEALRAKLEIPRLYGGTIHSIACTRPFFALGAVVVRVDQQEIAGLEAAVRRCLREQLPGNKIALQVHPNENRVRNRTVREQNGNSGVLVE